MITEFVFASKAFAPTAGELNEQHEDYINPDVFAKELADFLITKLADEGYHARERVVEDWGNWIELEHAGDFALAVCCANVEDFGDGSTLHRVATDPDKPHVRKFFRKIDVRADVERLGAALNRILTGSDLISDLRTSESTS